MTDTAQNNWTPSAQLQQLTRDQRESWDRGDKRLVEHYFEEHPELRADEKLLLDFICSEFALREEQGETPTLAEYRGRFPDVAQQLQLLFDVLQAIGAEQSLPSMGPLSSLASRAPLTPFPRSHGTIANARRKSGSEGGASGSNPPRQFGPYELLNEIARGGMGIVYKARQPKLDRIVAIKTILPQQFESDSAVRRFQIEAEAAAKLDHPGVVPIYDVGEQDGEHYLCMAYVDGESLATRLSRGPLPADDAARIVRDVAEAVHHAHERGIIHRDLKPANILIDNAGRPRVTDFGLARRQDVAGSLTADGSVIGTPAYMSPEQATGDSVTIGPLCDVYSLGAVLFHLLTGQPPFGSANVFEIIHRVQQEEPRRPREIEPSIPEPLETICLRCLAKDPRERYTSARALAEDLTRFLEGKAVSRPLPRRRSFPTSLANLPFAAMLVATISLLLVCAAIWVYRPSRAATGTPGAPAAPSTDPKPIAETLPPLTGELAVRIWDPHKNSSRHGLNFDTPGAMPLRYGDQIRVDVRINRPAYLYLFWITPEGDVTPIYPWTPATPWKAEYWNLRPKDERPIDVLSLPTEQGKGWPIDSGQGFETILLLARDEPLPANIAMDAIFAGLPPQQARQAHSFVVLEPGELKLAAKRSPNFSKLQTIDDSTQQLKQVLEERLKPLHFSLFRAICLSNRGS
jgi:serine/threonine protein kinase